MKKTWFFAVVVAVLVGTLIWGTISFLKNSELKEQLDKFHLDAKNISKYSLTLDLEAQAEVLRSLKEMNMSECWNALSSLFEENPDVFFSISVEGDTQKRLLPEISNNARGCTVLITYIAPASWSGSNAVIEVWDDDSWIDDLASKLVSATTVEINPSITAGAAAPVIIEAGQIHIEGSKVGKIKLISQDYVGQFTGVIPTIGNTISGDLTFKIKSQGEEKKIVIGKISMKNLGSIYQSQ